MTTEIVDIVGAMASAKRQLLAMLRSNKTEQQATATAIAHLTNAIGLVRRLDTTREYTDFEMATPPLPIAEQTQQPEIK